jgi:hypothetical protein
MATDIKAAKVSATEVRKCGSAGVAKGVSKGRDAVRCLGSMSLAADGAER